MFRHKVVFVVGAGASREYNFPLGSELKDKIAEAVRFRFEFGHTMVSGSHDLIDHIRRHVKGDHDRTNHYSKAANMLAGAIPAFVSVDEALHFVSGSPEAVEVGKIAIVHQILEAERTSLLAFDTRTGRPSELPGGWIGELFSLAVAGLRHDQLGSAFDNVTFVNFNYDRAVEQYLYWALQERTSATPEEAKSIVAKLAMLRPYGSIGDFSPNMHDPFSFGTTAHFDPFSRLADLGTYTDQKPMHDIAAMNNALTTANLIIFIGFGYHPSNVDLINLATGNGSAVVLGTVTGIHKSNHHLIAGRIANNLKMHVDSVDLHDMKAAELLRELRPRILMLVG